MDQYLELNHWAYSFPASPATGVVDTSCILKRLFANVLGFTTNDVELVRILDKNLIILPYLPENNVSLLTSAIHARAFLSLILIDSPILQCEGHLVFLPRYPQSLHWWPPGKQRVPQTTTRRKHLSWISKETSTYAEGLLLHDKWKLSALYR